MLLDAMRQCFEFCLALSEFFVAMVAGFYLLLRISQLACPFGQLLAAACSKEGRTQFIQEVLT